MNFRIPVSLILVVLLIQVHRSKNNYCAESTIKSVVIVPSCPTSKEMWDLAASKKHCETHAFRQNCTHATKFIYHCVINQYRNETLEVCAPQKIIFGYCTTFNVTQGTIQNHYLAPCNQSTFPKCDDIYVSSNAYKYSDCYQLVYNQRLNNTTSITVSLDHTTSSPHWEIRSIIMYVYIAACLPIFFGVIFKLFFTYEGKQVKFFRTVRHPSSKRDEWKKSVSGIGMTSLSEICYEDVASENDSYLFMGEEKNIQSMTSDDEDFSKEDVCENDSYVFTEIIGNNQTMTSDDEYFAKEDAYKFDSYSFTGLEENIQTMTCNEEHFSNEDACESDSLLYAEKVGNYQAMTSDDEEFAKEDAYKFDSYLSTGIEEINQTLTFDDEEFFKEYPCEGESLLYAEKVGNYQTMTSDDEDFSEEYAREKDWYLFTEIEENILTMTSDDEEFSKEDSCKNDSLLCAGKVGNNQTMISDDEDFPKVDRDENDWLLYAEKLGNIQIMTSDDEDFFKEDEFENDASLCTAKVGNIQIVTSDDEDFSEEDACDNISFLCTGIVGKDQKRRRSSKKDEWSKSVTSDYERNILYTRDTETQTTTDRLGYAMHKTEEDFREENKEESNRYLRYYRIIDKYFVETQTYKEAENTFSKYGIVIFTGLPGCGKTLAAIHLIRTIIHRTTRTFRKLQHWEELRYLDMNEKSLIFIDNNFFNTKTDKGIESWCDMLNMVNDRYHAVGLYFTGSYRLWIIMTVRSKLVASTGGYMDKEIHILNKEFCIDTSILTELEKNKILEMQIAFASKEKHSKIPIPFLDVSSRKKIILPEGPIGFPLCAHLYFCCEEYQRSGVQFFSRPIKYFKNLIKDEVEHDKSNKTKSLLLILFFRKWYSTKEGFFMPSIKSESICKQFLNKISPDLIVNFEPLDFRELEFTAQRLLNILVKDVGENKYDFVHDSVYEAVGAYFCEAYVSETAMYFPLDIIQHQTYEKLTSEQTVTLVTRLMYEALDKRLSEVFSCKIFQSTFFSQEFYLQLMKKDLKTIDHFITVGNESSNVKLPCMFWTSVNNLTSLTELFYEIVNERNISPCYNLYVALYGLCCYRHSSDILMTHGMHFGNLKDIRERVLMFRDDEDSCIINILISSTFSDRFVAIAIKQLLKDGMSIETRNKHRTSHLMIAVQQKLRRIQVIKILLERSQKFLLCDTTGSTVLHHCLGSAHDDKTCAQILNIIIGSCNNTDMFNQEDVNGDTALSIAAKYSKHSRIQSILILLEGCRDMVNGVNDAGLSPLHLAVRSFNNCSPCVQLECCVRVVILILSGADTDKKSDADVKAIDECQYDCIRNILHHPKDREIMKNELDCILVKLKNHEQTSTRSLSCLGKISEGLQGRITKTISYLQHMSFENVSSQ